jgi:multidrug efflux pump subunit AcrA (membrane-fusion protein)
VILTDATDEDEIEGEITYVAKTTGSSMSNSMSGGSSGYTIRIKIIDQDERLLVGMTAKCSIILEKASDVFAVPYDAIHTNSNGDSVIYVVDTSSASGTEESTDADTEDGETTDGTDKTMPDGEAPDGADSGKGMPDGEAPDGAGSGKEMPDGEAPDGAGSGKEMPDGEAPDGADFGDGTDSETESDSSDTQSKAGKKMSSDGNAGSTVNQKEIVVTKGMESDYYVEISGDDLTEGMQVILPSDTTTGSSDSSKDSDSDSLLSGLGGMTGGMDSGGGMGGGMNGGGMGGGGSAPSGGGPGR